MYSLKRYSRLFQPIALLVEIKEVKKNEEILSDWKGQGQGRQNWKWVCLSDVKVMNGVEKGAKSELI